MALPVLLTLTAGKSADFIRDTPNADGSIGGVFVGTEIITATVWPEDSEVAVLTQVGLPNAWISASSTSCRWLVSFNDAQTLTLTPGFYRIQVSAPQSTGRTGVLFEGNLEVTSSAGAVVPSRNLVSAPYVAKQLSEVGLNSAQWESLPDLITASSDAVVKWCGQRDFIRQIYTEEYSAELNGYIALKQMPVNQVLRIRGYQQTAMIVTASSTSFSSAWVQWITTGDWYSGTLAQTGLTLMSVAAGVQSSLPLLFANYPTINQLAAAIGAVPGWTANIQGNLGLFASTDLATTGTAQGAMDDDGAEFLVYSEDLTTTKLNNAIGFLWTGRRRIASAFGGRWGEDGGDLAMMDSPSVGRVQVTYDAGFSVVPTPVQMLVTELIKAAFARLKTDEMLQQEKAGQYAYTINNEMWAAIPKHIIQAASKYVIHRAS